MATASTSTASPRPRPGRMFLGGVPGMPQEDLCALGTNGGGIGRPRSRILDVEGLPKTADREDADLRVNLARYTDDLYREVESLLRQPPGGLDRADLVACMNRLEGYRITNDTKPNLLRPLKEYANMAVMIFLTGLRLHLLLRKHPDPHPPLAHYDPAPPRSIRDLLRACTAPPRGKPRRPTKPPYVRAGVRTHSAPPGLVVLAGEGSREEGEDASLLPYPGVHPASYTQGMVEVALVALQMLFREVQSPPRGIGIYLRDLEARIARMTWLPQTGDVLECEHLREPCEFRAAPPSSSSPSAPSRPLPTDRFVVHRDRLVYYAALLSSFRERLYRHLCLDRMERGDATAYWNDDEYRRFKTHVLEESACVAGKDAMSAVNQALTFSSLDASLEKYCLYVGEAYASRKDIVRKMTLRNRMSPVPMQVFKVLTNVVEGDDLDTVLEGADNLSRAMEKKHDVYGKSWANDYARLRAFDRLMGTPGFSPSRPEWLTHFVRFDRPKTLWEAPDPATPTLVERFGRFDLVYRDRLYETRSAFRAFYLWIKIGLSPEHRATREGITTQEIAGVVLEELSLRPVLEIDVPHLRARR